MSYVVLARKWRPQSFEDLVGPGARLHHDRQRHRAEPRGARLPLHRRPRRGQDDERPHPRQGAQLRERADGQALPEVPAVQRDHRRQRRRRAGDRRRQLQRRRRGAPPPGDACLTGRSRDRFKIFIVDEVHMLSNAAWNAFLKTLEEPPPHVKFIFATTEVHKVPVTILSRCQRYDFKLISAQTIAARLRLRARPGGRRRGRRGHRDPRARGRGQHARRHEPARSGDRLGRHRGRRSRRRAWPRCSGVAERARCSTAWPRR